MELSQEERYKKFFGDGGSSVEVEEKEEERAEVLDPGFAGDEATAMLLKIVAEEVNVAGASKVDKETAALAVAAATTLAAQVGVFDDNSTPPPPPVLHDETAAEMDLARRGFRLFAVAAKGTGAARFLALVRRGRLVAVRADTDETSAPRAILAIARLVDACVRCSLLDVSVDTLVEARLDDGDDPFAHLVQAKEVCRKPTTSWPELLVAGSEKNTAVPHEDRLLEGPIELRCYMNGSR